MTSPYIRDEAEKLGISSKAEYRREDYIAPRSRSDATWRDLEQSEVPISWGRLLADAAGAILLVVVLWWAADHAAAWLSWWHLKLRYYVSAFQSHGSP